MLIYTVFLQRVATPRAGGMALALPMGTTEPPPYHTDKSTPVARRGRKARSLQFIGDRPVAESDPAAWEMFLPLTAAPSKAGRGLRRPGRREPRPPYKWSWGYAYVQYRRSTRSSAPPGSGDPRRVPPQRAGARVAVGSTR